jgi:hypothetical protein
VAELRVEPTRVRAAADRARDDVRVGSGNR